ncbi:SusC/RagA family TonB-linked outer membrane protein [Sphingobacterium kitahiroshimense]|uniref:SusC/RagA family TonB-linked outer membrane protein n=1 Tax=Sphingobacterium kitahiroshimense TaxID=470446 RepID=A0ABV0C012_9SPHI
MQKKCNRESYALSRRKNTVLNPVLFFGLQSKTNQNINTLKSPLLKKIHDRNNSSEEGSSTYIVTPLEIDWLKLVLCILLSPILHAFNLLLCLLRAIKVIAIFCIMIIAVFHSLCLSAQIPRKDSGVNGQVKYELTGVVVSSTDGTPLQGVSVRIEAENLQVKISKDGRFQLTVSNKSGKIRFSSIGFKSQELNYTAGVSMTVRLIPEDNQLDEVEVVSTGYQKIPKERATGSFVQIDNELLNRTVSTNVLDRLKGVSSGVLFDASTGTDNGFSVRGRSTIFANTDPLIVLDNFAYDGDISTINPNDIEKIDILRDAAAASIWGVRAGNGVIVITTKSGKYRQPVKVVFNANHTIGERPRLFKTNELGPADVIDLEIDLYKKGYYSNAIASPYAYISPIVQLLADEANGLSSPAQVKQQITELKNQDIRNDYLKYYYRKSQNSQYAFNLNGGGENNRYFVSVGHDRNQEILASDHSNRWTLNAQNSYRMFNGRLEASLGLNYSSIDKESNSGNILNPLYLKPYVSLADENGNSLPVDTYKQQYLDTVGQGRMLDWYWRPLDELKNNNRHNRMDNYGVNLDVTVKIMDKWTVGAKYQYSKGTSNTDNLLISDSYYTRDLINKYAQINYKTNEVIYPIPLGDILEKDMMMYTSNNLRLQSNYAKDWQDHELSALIGLESKDYQMETNSSTLYGFDQDLGYIAPVDYRGYYINSVTRGSVQIPGSPSQYHVTDRYFSIFANALYSFRKRYSLSGSMRRDESNLFGVKANQKGVPLWSLGASWNIAEETFFNFSWVDALKLRITNGYNGNVNKEVSAFVTAQVGANNRFGAPTATIVNPPNPTLRWEKINMTNLGLDFTLFNKRFSGNVEYYFKKGKDIIGYSPLAPSSGVTSFLGNSADISGRGFDLNIHALVMDKVNFRWTMDFLWSRTLDHIEEYMVKSTPLGFHVGYPFNGTFSYRWAGLDPQNGDPQGFLAGAESKDWVKINASDSIGNTTVYNGSGTPVHFGSLRPTLRYKNLNLSFSFIYKMGYYFRAPSVNYQSLYALNASNATHKDYLLRWQNPGDELKTNVPSAAYPANYARDYFYLNSEKLVQRGDHIRLQDIRLDYSFNLLNQQRKLPINVYLYASNIGIIWRKNNLDLDPESLLLPMRRTLSLGLKTNF